MQTNDTAGSTPADDNPRPLLVPPTARLSIDEAGRVEATLWASSANLPPGDYDVWRDAGPLIGRAPAISRACLRFADPLDRPSFAIRSEPCAECHLPMGEECDVCGVRAAAADPAPTAEGKPLGGQWRAKRDVTIPGGFVARAGVLCDVIDAGDGSALLHEPETMVWRVLVKADWLRENFEQVNALTFDEMVAQASRIALAYSRQTPTPFDDALLELWSLASRGVASDLMIPAEKVLGAQLGRFARSLLASRACVEQGAHTATAAPDDGLPGLAHVLGQRTFVSVEPWGLQRAWSVTIGFAGAEDARAALEAIGQVPPARSDTAPETPKRVDAVVLTRDEADLAWHWYDGLRHFADDCMAHEDDALARRLADAIDNRRSTTPGGFAARPNSQAAKDARDAKRYRALRDSGRFSPSTSRAAPGWGLSGSGVYSADQLDADADALVAKQAEAKGGHHAG